MNQLFGTFPKTPRPMSQQIDYDTLYDLLSSPATQAQALEQYFYFDDSRPFSGGYRLKESIVLVTRDKTGEEMDGFMASSLRSEAMKKANTDSRRQRDRAFDAVKNDPNRVLIVSEGDSWFQYPKFNLLVNITKGVKDIIDYLMEDPRYAIKSLDAAGDVLRNMYHHREYLRAVGAIQPRILLISAGGNDFFEVFEKMLQGSAAADVEKWLSPNYSTELAVLKQYYSALLLELTQLYPGLNVIIHGYDYIIPDPKKGKWIGEPMLKAGLHQDQDRRALIRFIMDRYNEMQHSLSQMPEFNGRVHYLDLRNTVPQDPNFWHDEIHPNDQGFELIAEKYKQKIAAVLETGAIFGPLV
jgi:lysophospholipase L1-like esterase